MSVRAEVIQCPPEASIMLSFGGIYVLLCALDFQASHSESFDWFERLRNLVSVTNSSSCS